MTQTSLRPTELRVSKDRMTLSVAFGDGTLLRLPAEMLRVLSPSAEVQGHGAGQRKLVHGKRKVAIAQVVPTGNYAVRIVFDDGHDTGIYSWPFLRELGAELEGWPTRYEAELAEKGLSRG
ncbi:MAG: DUF971 domain-containing protein [Pseudomonadota bacterium]|nr:DUF971 domain-containing protein [Pseudomonadota bacterium]